MKQGTSDAVTKQGNKDSAFKQGTRGLMTRVPKIQSLSRVP